MIINIFTDLWSNTAIKGLLTGFIAEIILQILKNKVHNNSWLTIIGFITNILNALNNKLPSGNVVDPKTDQSKIEHRSGTEQKT